MANSTDEYWSIDGVSLHQYGWSVATVGGARYDLPTRRGENRVFAYRPGEVHRPKLAQARTIELVMWVTGQTPGSDAFYDTATPGLGPAVVADPRLRWNDSWDFLRRMVWKPNGAQVTLTRRWWLTVGGTPTLVTADAQAEIADAMPPTMTGRHRAEFVMELVLADPYFYGPEITTNLAVGVPTSVVNPGHDVAGHAHMQLDLIGQLDGARVTNATPNPDVYMRYDPRVDADETVRLDVPSFRANQVSDGANLIGNVRSAGSRYWMALLPGSNLVTLTATISEEEQAARAFVAAKQAAYDAVVANPASTAPQITAASLELAAAEAELAGVVADTDTGSAQLRFRPPYI